MPTARTGVAVLPALRSVRRSLHWQGRRAVVTTVLGVLALVGLPSCNVPQDLRDHRLAETGAVVEAVVLSTDVRGARNTRLTAVVQPDAGPPAYVDQLFAERPLPGDRLPVVVDPDDPGRALLAGTGSDVRLAVAQSVGLGLLGWLFVTAWGSLGLVSRTVREELAAAVASAVTTGPAAVAVPFRVVRSRFPLAAGTSYRERVRLGDGSQHEVLLALSDGRTLSGQWARGARLARGARGVAVGALSPGGQVALVVGRTVLWPTAPVEVQPPAGQLPSTTTGRPRSGDGPRADGVR